MKNPVERLTERLIHGDSQKAALVFSEKNRRYFTQFPATDGALLVTAEEAYLLMDFRYEEAARYKAKYCTVMGFTSLPEKVGELVKSHGVKQVYMECEELSVAQARTLEKALQKAGAQAVLDDTLDEAVREQRMIKSPEEVKKIEASQEITDAAFQHILSYIKEGVTERELALEIEFFMRRQGAEGNAFDPIVAAGKNGSQCHAVPSDYALQKGDFITMDTGALLDGYNSDMTRTVPVNGKFTPRQRAVYESVLNMMTYAKSILRPGILKSEYERLVRVFAAGELVKLGLVTPAQVAEKPSDPPIVRKYYMHGCSHFLGLDVHDVGETNPVVLPGMVFTIEPGIYIAEEGIGIRLENDILIGEKENIDLLGDVPLLPDDIERLMAR